MRGGKVIDRESGWKGGPKLLKEVVCELSS